MAKNWTISDAVVAVKNNDSDAIMDLGKRYPLLLHRITQALAKAPEEVEGLMSIMPEYLTANKLNKILVDGIDAAENDMTDDEDDAAEEKPAKKPAPAAKKKPAAKAPVEDDEDDDEESDGDAPFDENMGSKEMYALCGKLGIKKTLKDTKKPTMIAALKKYYAEHGAEAAGEDDDAEDETSENPYEGMKAIDLFNMCKERGIKAKPKQKAAFYVDLLTKADAEAAEADDDDDDWDEEEPEEKPAKKPAASAKKGGAKKSKSAAKEEAEDESDDDDDEWDI